MCHKGQCLGPLFFLIYISDLTANLKCSVKLFAEDTSLFTIVQDPDRSASDVNLILNRIALWAQNKRILFNSDAQNQAVELVFLKKKLKGNHPALIFNGSPVEVVDQHKHLGIILDSKLPRNTVNEMYKLYVRPHRDHSDVFYKVPQKAGVSENDMMSKLESVQYSASLAVTGAWRGTSRDKLYNELG